MSVAKRTDVHIICQKCQKPVDNRMLEIDQENGKYIYAVACHGAEQTISIDIAGAHNKTIEAFKEPTE